MHHAWTAIKFLRWDFKGTMAYQEEKCLVVQCPLFWNCWLLYDIKVALQHWKGSNHTVKWKYNCCNRNFLVLENIRTRVSSFSDPTTKNKTMQVNKVLSYIHFHSAPPILVRTELTVIRTIGIAWKTVENGKKIVYFTLWHKSSTAVLKRQKQYSEMEMQLLQSKLLSAWKYSDASLKFCRPHNPWATPPRGLNKCHRWNNTQY